MESISSLKSTRVDMDVGSCPDMIEIVSGGESIRIVVHVCICQERNMP